MIIKTLFPFVLTLVLLGCSDKEQGTTIDKIQGKWLEKYTGEDPQVQPTSSDGNLTIDKISFIEFNDSSFNLDIALHNLNNVQKSYSGFIKVHDDTISFYEDSSNIVEDFIFYLSNQELILTRISPPLEAIMDGDTSSILTITPSFIWDNTIFKTTGVFEKYENQ